MSRGKVYLAALSCLVLALIASRQNGERSILDENGSSVTGGPALQNKNSDAMNLLARVFGGGSKAHSAHEAHKLAISAKQSPAKKSAIKKLTAKGKLGSPKYTEHRGRKVAAAGGGIPPIPTAPHILGALPGQGGPLGGPGGGPPNPVQEGLQAIMGGWTGAGWWQPCSEVCTAGRSRAEMKTAETFKQFQACESNCRKTKAGQLKKVIAHVKEVVAEEGGPTGGPAGGNRAMPPPHMMAQRVSKHLLKWAETQGLPKKLADNPKDAAQVGQSVTGMLIAGWSQAGWWQPCGQVCRGSKHFKEFMACEQKCQAVKSSLIENTMDPKTFGPPQNAKGARATAKVGVATVTAKKPAVANK